MTNAIYDLQGRTCAITGASSGIGRATACALAAAGANLILMSRREPKGQSFVQKLPDRLQFLRLDLADQSQIRDVASRLAKNGSKIDVLINNAGARFNTFQESADGVELTFATNHLGHFLLTSLLIQGLVLAPNARIITVGSSAHRGIPATGDWCSKRNNYDRKLAYGKSKLANIMFAYEFARRLGHTNMVSNAVDPGGVATNLGRNNGLVSWCRHLLYYALKRELAFPGRVAESLVYLAADSSLEGLSGKYFYRKQQIVSSAASYDHAAAADLWAFSLGLTR